MGRRATVGTTLASLVKTAVPLCRRAERECPRTGPGRKPEIPDWVPAVLMMVAVLKRKRSESSQHRFLNEHRGELKRLLGTCKFPARSTYFDRYRRARRLFQHAIKLQSEKAIDEGVADAQDVAVDKSLVAARGPLWHKSDRKRKRIPRGLHGKVCTARSARQGLHGKVCMARSARRRPRQRLGLFQARWLGAGRQL